jgi:putative N6-adenine-specific DNA methylase
MAEPAECFAITAPGIEGITAAELTALGGSIDSTEPGGVSFRADDALLYRANLELRTASRVLKRVGQFEARTWFELERHAKKIPWDGLLKPGMVPEFEVTSRKSKLYHNRGIAERLERLVGADGKAADVDPSRRAAFHVRVLRDRFTLSADASGELLHRRGYRLETAKAPLRETLAAAMLLGCEWNGTTPLVDPFCGSGTIPIEAALLARRMAPGLNRSFAFEAWPDFDAALWRQIRADAMSRIGGSVASIMGSDRDAGAIEACVANAERAGVEVVVEFRNRPLSAMDPMPGNGLLLTNPPYGARIGEEKALRNLYAQLGNVARTRLPGWRVALLGANPRLEGQVGMPLHEIWRSNNGGIPVHLVAS